MEFRKKVVAQVERITGKAESAFSAEARKKIRIIMKYWDADLKPRFDPRSLWDLSKPWKWFFQGETIVIFK